ncbi:YkgB family protein [Mycobacterium heidelbergense]|uniref:YkgB family protein n=1 Tax=Mycobacterium heidelbergense TaxID=53376 RepID=UPI003CF5764E
MNLRYNVSTQNSADSTMRLGSALARYGLVIVIAWFGVMKFTNYEAQGIQPLIAHSPFMSWLYAVFSVRTFSTLLGIFELAAALLLSLKPFSPRASIVGSVMAIGLFVATISFLFTTPDVFDAAAGGFPLLSTDGGFLIKDVALLGLAVWTLADALAARATPSGG